MATSHKRDTPARRTPPVLVVAGPIAVLATVGAVLAGVAVAGPSDHHRRAASSASAVLRPTTTATRPEQVTRSEDRASASAPTPAPSALGTMSRAAVRTAVAQAHTHEWTTTDLNLWTRPDGKATEQGELDAGKKVLVTGRRASGRTELVVDGQSRWVTDGYLTTTKPAGAGAGLSHEPCPDMSVEHGLVPAMIYVYRSVCHAFPQVTTYYGLGPRPEHDTGHALDIMVYDDKALGEQIAQYLQAHAAELDLYDLLWQQHIWTPVRASEGWRPMPDRGSPTANHMNHVHVGVN